MKENTPVTKINQYRIKKRLLFEKRKIKKPLERVFIKKKRI